MPKSFKLILSDLANHLEVTKPNRANRVKKRNTIFLEGKEIGMEKLNKPLRNINSRIVNIAKKRIAFRNGFMMDSEGIILIC